jgi:hypothetical protein
MGTRHRFLQLLGRGEYPGQMGAIVVLNADKNAGKLTYVPSQERLEYQSIRPALDHHA